MRNGVSLAVEAVTPAKAIEWLASAAPNRPLNRRLVERIKADLRAGSFVFNGESIVFGEDGAMLDGRHRSTACAESGVGFESVVVRGVPETAMSSFDGGDSRSLGHRLAIAGVDTGLASAAGFASVVTWTWRLANRAISIGSGDGGTGRGKTFGTLHEALVTIERYPGMRRGIELAGHTPARAIIAAVYAIVADAKGSVYEPFAEGYRTGANLTPKSPVLLLRNRLILGRERDGIGRRELTRIPLSLQAALVIKAWNAYVLEGKEIKQLKATSGATGSGRGGEAFPVIAFGRYWGAA